MTGRGGVPALAAAVVLNIAVTESLAAGFITAYPCGSPRPNAASVNHVAGETIPNAVTVKVGVGGRVCFYSLATTHLVVDADAYVL